MFSLMEIFIRILLKNQSDLKTMDGGSLETQTMAQTTHVIVMDRAYSETIKVVAKVSSDSAIKVRGNRPIFQLRASPTLKSSGPPVAQETKWLT